MQAGDNVKTASSLIHRPLVVGLTGGIGAGKSSARAVFETLGVPCLDIDLVARKIHQDPDHPAMSALAREIPAAIASDGTLQRGRLRTLFAVDTSANLILKRLLKPHVMAEAERWTRAQSALYVVWESALLIDEAIACDSVLLIDATDDDRHARIRVRNPDWSDAEIESVMRLQPSRSTYLEHADEVIVNQGARAELETQVTRLHRKYMKTWS